MEDPPNIVLITRPFIEEPRAVITVDICFASSWVGARIIACVLFSVTSIRWSVPIENVPVFPLPDWAWAIISCFCRIGKMARFWISLGFSNP